MKTRYRKPMNLSLDPALVERMKTYCHSQEGEPKLARMVDLALKEFLEKRVPRKEE